MSRKLVRNKYINCGDTTLVCLSNGKYAMVDTVDVERIYDYRWMCHRGMSTYYARTHKWNGKKAESTLMHRMLVNAPSGVIVDHVNHDGLDNRKSNLRLCTHLDNSRNRRCTNGYKGVNKCGNTWQANIRVMGVLKYLGSFKSKDDAALAYNNAALKYFGEYACLNEVKI